MFEISNIGIITAFTAGLVSFLSPCVLPLVPGYVSYISGSALNDGAAAPPSRLQAVLLSACFVLGFSIVFVALGASASLASRLLLQYRYETTIIGGAIIIVFGLFTMGLLRLSWFERDFRFHGNVRGAHPLGAILLGLVFGFGWTPCIGPVLGAILTVSAISASASAGVALLCIYSLGLGVPFLLSAAFTDSLTRRLKPMRRAGRFLQFGAGAVMAAMGVAMMTGYMSAFSFWLLENIPLLAQIG
jgi:cytochrome c-type biogenesis protein